MTIIALRGIRGGVGTTAVTAGLAYALFRLGVRVLVLDLSPDNQLRLHFNTQAKSPRGWALAESNKASWHEGAMRYQAGLDFVPYGKLPQGAMTAATIDWSGRLVELEKKDLYDFVLLDLPANANPDWLAGCDHLITLLNADANCHVRLWQHETAKNERWLLNRFAGELTSQRELLQEWQQSAAPLLPLVIHRDEAMAEAMLAKQPTGEYQAGSLAADELNTLASWCLLQGAQEADQQEYRQPIHEASLPMAGGADWVWQSSGKGRA